MQQIDICGISRNFSRLSRCYGQVAYALLTRAPVAARELPRCAAPRLACVKPVASVHPEPGSNSPLLFIFFFLFFSDKKHRPLSPDRWLLLDGGFRPLCLSCLTVALFQCPLCSSEPLLRRLAGRPRFGVASAKVQQIKLPTKLFYNFFVLNFHAFLQSIETQQNSITIFLNKF